MTRGIRVPLGGEIEMKTGIRVTPERKRLPPSLSSLSFPSWLGWLRAEFDCFKLISGGVGSDNKHREASTRYEGNGCGDVLLDFWIGGKTMDVGRATQMKVERWWKERYVVGRGARKTVAPTFDHMCPASCPGSCPVTFHRSRNPTEHPFFPFRPVDIDVPDPCFTCILKSKIQRKC